MLHSGKKQLFADNPHESTQKSKAQSKLQVRREHAPKAGKPCGIVAAKAGDLRGELSKPGKKIVDTAQDFGKQIHDLTDDLTGQVAQLGE